MGIRMDINTVIVEVLVGVEAGTTNMGVDCRVWIWGLMLLSIVPINRASSSLLHSMPLGIIAMVTDAIVGCGYLSGSTSFVIVPTTIVKRASSSALR